MNRASTAILLLLLSGSFRLASTFSLLPGYWLEHQHLLRNLFSFSHGSSFPLPRPPQAWATVLSPNCSFSCRKKTSAFPSFRSTPAPLRQPCSLSHSVSQSLVEIAFSGQADKVCHSKYFALPLRPQLLQHVASPGWIEEVRLLACYQIYEQKPHPQFSGPSCAFKWRQLRRDVTC
jgi:hypothetical protein